jgi:hypothetical protein
MSAELPVLNGERVRALLEEVAELLRVRDHRSTIVIAGGSLLAWLNLRDSTRDVDSVRALDPEVRQAVLDVARRHDMATTWLNDFAAPFWPATLDVTECETLLDNPSLTVLGVPLSHVLLMKLHRSDPADLDDIRRIWPYVAGSFRSAADVVGEYFAAFPLEQPDEHLADFVVEQLELGGHQLPLA